MKCHKCSSDNLLPERSNGRCKRCQHPIVFDPRRTNDPFNDNHFLKALEAISASGSLKFSTRQFYYFMNTRKFGVGVPMVGCVAILMVPICFIILVLALGTGGNNNVFFVLMWTIFLYFVTVLLAYWQGARNKLRPQIKWNHEKVKDYLSRWEYQNGLVGALLPNPSKSIPAAADLPSEILDYSFDRLIVTQHDEIAQFLIANNFHFENNCAVLSINKYPSTLFDIVMKMLRNNETLKVYALHDASWLGLAMLDTLCDDEIWFGKQPSAQIIDLGLVPRQFENRRAFVEKCWTDEFPPVHSLSEKIKRSLSAKETSWLNERNIVRLESIAPQRLLKLITQGIACSRDPDKKDALVPLDADTAVATGGIYVFAADSFG